MRGIRFPHLLNIWRHQTSTDHEKAFFSWEFSVGLFLSLSIQAGWTPGFSSEELEARFTTRARTYRARQHRHTVRLLWGLIGAILVVNAALRVPLKPARTAEIRLASEPYVMLEEIVQTRHEVLLPPPRPAMLVVVPDDEILEDDVLLLDAMLDVNQPLAALPPPPVSDEDEESDTEEERLFVAVAHMPEIIGGLRRLVEDLTYPEYALRARIEGVVVVQIIVNEEGNPEQPQVVESPSEVLGQAAVAAVMKQRFKPGMQRNRPVRVMMSIPVRFRLH